MTPAFLLLFILSMTDVSLSDPDVNEDEIETPVLLDDIALPDTLSRNADPCTATGCKWPKTGRYVYVPYYISPRYNSEERSIILKGLKSFNQTTCIRLVPWRSEHHHYLHFVPQKGCWSYIGRQNQRQYISLEKDGCVKHRTVQHEVLHALGFEHEISRSDRDKYVRILFNNIEPKKKNNFEKIETNNLLTPYDFKSVMQYRKYSFSRNGKPTIIARSDPNLDFGHAKQMSKNDIARVNRLYKCCSRRTPCTLSA